MTIRAKRILPYLLPAAGLMVFTTVFAQQGGEEADQLDALQLGMGLFGGLALFLGGLDVLSEGMKKAAGDTLRNILEKLTVNRFLGAITGAFVTGVLNSSSVTTVLVVGFVTAGVMSLSQSVGVIMGANIGSTLTAQLLAFNLAAYSLIPVAIGFFMNFTAKTDRTKYFGMMILGLGLVFYGMGLMSEGMKPLRDYEPFLDILAKMDNPMLGILAGAVFTGLVQSSAATVGIAIAMASEGLLALPAGIALALGANIGTCVTALLAALGKPVEAVRASVVHITFNIIGVVIWLPVLSMLADIAVDISPKAIGLEGKAKLAAEVPRQIANANTMFNVINTLLFISFTTWFSRMAEKLVPDRAPVEGLIIEPDFLDEAALEVPSIALENARREIQRAGNIILGMMDTTSDALEKKDLSLFDEIARCDDQVDILESHIMGYLARIRQQMLTEEEGTTQQALVAAMIDIASISDMLDTDMSQVCKTHIQGKYEKSSKETRDMVEGLFETVRQSIEKVIEAVGQNDQSAAQDVLLLKDEVRSYADSLVTRHANRLRVDDPKYLQRVRLLMTFVEKLRQMYTLTKRIAKTQLPVEVARQEV